jgi:histidine triad (HIT) family protein
MSEDCLFCKIVSGAIPSDAVLDQKSVYAFRDIAPAAPVHVLVVPKVHISDTRDVTVEHGQVLAEMLMVANRVAEDEGLGSGYRLVFNVGPDAGQTVFHLHLHVLGGKPLGPMASR